MAGKGRPTSDFRLTLRKNVGIYYGKLPNWKTFHSTDCRNEKDAKRTVNKWLYGNITEAQFYCRTDKDTPITFGSFTEHLFDPDGAYYSLNQNTTEQGYESAHVKNMKGYLKNYLIPQFGNRLIESISRNEIKTYLSKLNRSKETKNHFLSCLSIIFKCALEKDIVEKNPIGDINRFRGESKARDALTQEEFRMLFPWNDSNELIRIWKHLKWASFMSLMATTGMRVSEVIALQWGDIQKDKNKTIIQINKAAKDNGVVGSTKTKKSGAGYVLEKVYDLLIQWKNESPFSTEPHALIFPNNEGKLLNRKTALMIFGEALNRAGISKAGKNLVLHSLRHTFVTLSHEAGVENETIRSSTNHTNDKTIGLYTHHELEAKINRLDLDKEKLEEAFS